MSLVDAPAQLQTHVDAFAREITALLAGKKAAAPRARKHLQDIKTLVHTLRATILESTKTAKPPKNEATVADPQPTTSEPLVLAAASDPLPTAALPPKVKRVRTVKVKKEA